MDKACSQFRMTWDELTKLPSRYSAEALEREARDELLKRVTENGYVDDTTGIVRIAKDGYIWSLCYSHCWRQCCLRPGAQ